MRAKPPGACPGADTVPAAKHFRSEYPLAHEGLISEGSHVLMDLREFDPSAGVDELIVLDRGGQVGWKSVVSDRYHEFDFEERLAIRWHVAGRGSPVIIDPRISFGAPMVGGIATWAVAGRYGAGETVEDLQDDFKLTKEEILAALNFEGM